VEPRARRQALHGKILNSRPSHVAIMHDLTLWGVGTSRTMRPHWMLLELGLEYHFHPIGSRTGETQTTEFMQLNPRHKIPVLRHGSFILTESAAIIQYLSETFSNPDLMEAPRDAASRATLNEWCYYIATELDAASLYVMRRHIGLEHIYGTAPKAVESARSYFIENVEAMAPRIARSGRYVMGERFCVADILLTTCLDWATMERIPLSEPLREYRSRVASRPAYQKALERNFSMSR
jgi:glutathione S-transferase